MIFDIVKACVKRGNKTLCHVSCKTCDKSKYCDDETACTNCPEGHNRIFINENVSIFKCKENCTGASFEITKDNFVCEEEEISPKNNLHVNFVQNPGDFFAETKGPAISVNYFFVVIFGFIFILLIIAILFLFCALRMKKIQQALSEKHENVEAATLIKLSNNKPKKEEKQFQNLEIITNLEEIKIESELGSGGFSKVYSGTFRNQPVAIKMAKSDGRKSIHKELQIFDKISHSRIVPALGVHLGIENMLILALRKQNLRDYFLDYGNEIKFPQLKQCCIQIAEGLKYLHSKSILHCDLKIENILVKDDKGDQVEISDFGCAIDLKCDYNPTAGGTLTHRSYELLKTKLYPYYKVTINDKIDVWAFGVTAWQIFKKSHLLPNDFIKVEEIIQNYENGKMLPQPPDTPKELWRHVFFPCFNICPTVRPSMEELYNSLIKFQDIRSIK